MLPSFLGEGEAGDLHRGIRKKRKRVHAFSPYFESELILPLVVRQLKAPKVVYYYRGMGVVMKQCCRVFQLMGIGLYERGEEGLEGWGEGGKGWREGTCRSKEKLYLPRREYPLRKAAFVR